MISRELIFSPTKITDIIKGFLEKNKLIQKAKQLSKQKYQDWKIYSLWNVWKDCQDATQYTFRAKPLSGDTAALAPLDHCSKTSLYNKNDTGIDVSNLLKCIWSMLGILTCLILTKPLFIGEENETRRV